MYTRTCLQRYITTCTQINAWQNASTEKEAALPSRATSFKSTMPARLPQPVTVSKQFQQRHTTPGKWTTRSMASEPRYREREREREREERESEDREIERTKERERNRVRWSTFVNIWQGILHDVNMPAATSSRLLRTLWIELSMIPHSAIQSHDAEAWFYASHIDVCILHRNYMKTYSFRQKPFFPKST